MWLLLSLLVLAACAPQTSVETNVQPTIFSVTSPGEVGSELVLQGRYLGDGQEGNNSYVVLGADINGDGGGRIKTTSWSPSRITLDVPKNAGYEVLLSSMLTRKKQRFTGQFALTTVLRRQ